MRIFINKTFKQLMRVQRHGVKELNRTMATVKATGLRFGDDPDETRVSATGRFYGGPKQLVIRVDLKPKIPSYPANWDENYEVPCSCRDCSDDESEDDYIEDEADSEEDSDSYDEEDDSSTPVVRKSRIVSLNAKTGKTLEVTEVISAQGY
jgi:hypothetical protein